MKKKLIAAASVLALAAGAWSLLRGRRGAVAESAPVAVERGDIRVAVAATGVAEPQNRVELKPPIAGRVEEILVREGDEVKKGAVLARLSSVERAALLDAARAKGPEELAHWEDLYRATPLIAPLTGVVIARNVEPGQTVTAQDPVLVMSNRLIVKAQVDETDISQIEVGQDAEITLDAFPRRSIAGEVDHIAFEAKTVSNVTMYEVKIVPDRVPDFMRSGMTANVSFVVAEKEGVLLVPADAVRREQRKSVVTVAGDSGKGEPREVETGLSDGRRTEVVSGLAEGEKVLVKTLRMPDGTSAGTNPFMPFGGGRRSGQGGQGGRSGQGSGGRRGGS